jgi:hypothetical protein
MVVDTGATVNNMDENTLSKLKSQPKLNNTKTKIYPYGSGKSSKCVVLFLLLLSENVPFFLIGRLLRNDLISYIYCKFFLLLDKHP